MNRCVIFGGGEIEDLRYAQNLLRKEDYLICADRGYAYCMSMGVAPDLVLGDFDSYSGSVLPTCELLRFPVEKDDTDTMLAIKTALENGCKEIFLYGGTGGVRLDHTLANLQSLLYLRRRGARGWMYDRDFLWTVIENESLTVERTVEWGLLSVFCLGADASGVDEEGVQYPLKDALLTADFPLGVSNHILEPAARITVRQGALAVGWQLLPE